MATVYYANIDKRKNSTKQATFTNSYTCALKDATSLNNPVFLFQGSWIGWNVAKWGDRYYFVDDVVAVHNDLWEIHCSLDVLATYKSKIIASTQFVSYSSVSGDTWLPDTRIPVTKSATHGYTQASLSSYFDVNNGYFALTCLSGNGGCYSYAVSKAGLQTIIQNISNWATGDFTDTISGTRVGGYNWATAEDCLQSLGSIISQVGALGNAYDIAPNCIRSCVWIPFKMSRFAPTLQRIYLGLYDTGVDGYIISQAPVTDIVPITIPWRHSDWRRSYCESVYLYLPLVGNINLSTDDIIDSSALSIRVSMSGIDGSIAYTVYANSNEDECMGVYSANCSVNYAIGINQSASFGSVARAAMAGSEKVVNSLINTSLSPVSAGAGVVGSVMAGISTSYDINNISVSTNPTVIGSMGGSVAAGLSLNIEVSTTSFTTIIAPSSMQATMGLPTMKPMSLSSLSGYCQCANAHVSCDADGPEKDMIDTYLNTGFFIE